MTVDDCFSLARYHPSLVVTRTNRRHPAGKFLFMLIFFGGFLRGDWMFFTPNSLRAGDDNKVSSRETEFFWDPLENSGTSSKHCVTQTSSHLRTIVHFFLLLVGEVFICRISFHRLLYITYGRRSFYKKKKNQSRLGMTGVCVPAGFNRIICSKILLSFYWSVSHGSLAKKKKRFYCIHIV